MKSETETIDYSKPVAYDDSGRPLYAHPSGDSKQHAKTQILHTSKVSVGKKLITEDAKQRHTESVKNYPRLNLSEGEYVISAVRRHWIGLAAPIILGFLLSSTIALLLFFYPIIVPNDNPPFNSVVAPAILFLVLVGLGTYIAVWVYLNNRFFLTNESVIQEIQTSLFASKEQTVSLLNIEDASYTQTGIVQLLFNYGSIRLSTQGDETTYRFQYVSNPKHQIALLNNTVEAFKNGHPMNDN